MPQYAGPSPKLLQPPVRVTVYRYFPLTYGLEALQTGIWKVGRMTQLNDPFDCRPKFINDVGESFPGNLIQRIMGQWGLFCFCGVNNNSAVWSHYADSHRGLALGFNLEVGPMGPHLVTYSNVRPILKAEDIVKARGAQPPNAVSFVFQSSYLTKEESWIYEREYRLFVSLDDCEMRGEHYFQRLPVGELNEVILGADCKMTMADIDRVIWKAKNPATNTPLYTAARVRQCRISENTFDLELVNGLGETEEESETRRGGK